MALEPRYAGKRKRGHTQMCSTVARVSATTWAFTINNYTDSDLTLVRELVSSEKDVQYILFGFEVAKSGTKHLQGMIKLHRTHYMQWVKDNVHQYAHWEKMIVSDVNLLMNYCKKDGIWEEYGTPPKGQGHRSDWDSLKSDMQADMGLQEVSNKHFRLFVQNGRGLTTWASLNSRPLTRQAPRIIWLFGSTGTGKTQAGMAMVANRMTETYFLSNSNSGNGCWWPNYHDHKVVFLDDLRKWMPCSDALRVFQSAPHTVSQKGGSARLAADTFIVTTNLPPESTYDDVDGVAFLRRIHDFAWVYEVFTDRVRLRSFPNVHGRSMSELLTYFNT